MNPPPPPRRGWGTFARIVPYMKRHRRDLFLGFAFLLPGNACELGVPWVIARGVDAAVAGDRTLLRLLGYGALAMLLVFLKSACRFAMRWFTINASRAIERDLRLDLFAKLTTLPPAFYARSLSGDLISRMTADVEAVRMVAGPALMYLSTTLTLMPIAWMIMFSLHPTLTLWTLVPILTLSIVLLRLSPRLETASTATQKAIARVSEIATESFSGVRILKMFCREQTQVERVAGCGRDYIDAQMRFARERGRTQALLAAIRDLGHLVILTLGAVEIVQRRFSVGEFFLFNDLLIRMSIPMMTTGWVALMLHRGAAAMRRIDEIFDTVPEIRPPDAPRGLEPLRSDVHFDGVGVDLGGTTVLSEISFKVESGRSLGITGRTGSGKSTLAALLPRLLDPTRGIVRVAGVDVRELSLEVLRRSVALVPQEAFLFSASLRDNLTFAVDGKAGAADLERAMFDCALDRDLTAFPDGFETRIGERGLTLSGGQRQRSTLGRALLVDAPILVIDDGFSAVDTETEALILERLKARRRGKTTIVISHRVQALKHLDEILVLEHGRLVERGTHASLSAGHGWYARLERMQSLERELTSL